jgi:hypothetical protein
MPIVACRYDVALTSSGVMGKCIVGIGNYRRFGLIGPCPAAIAIDTNTLVPFGMTWKPDFDADADACWR